MLFGKRSRELNINYMKRYFSVLSFVSMALLLVSCSKSNEAAENTNNPGGGGTGTCNTTNMKYSADIVPIIQANCYACHSNANMAISGISLQGHSNLKIQADNGSLVGAITHASGYEPMPQGGAKLSDCDINKIKSWVNAGALNN